MGENAEMFKQKDEDIPASCLVSQHFHRDPISAPHTRLPRGTLAALNLCSESRAEGSKPQASLPGSPSPAKGLV